MYKKTTSSFFNEFGIITDRNKINSLAYTHKVYSNPASQLYVLEKPITLSVKSGIVLLIVKKADTSEQFVIHAEIQLNSGVEFQFIAITENAVLNTSIDLSKHTPSQTLETPIVYKKIEPSFYVKEIYAYYHQTKPPQYEFQGETLQYWELTYVDRGNLEMTIDNQTHQLNAFDLIISAPGQFHSQKVTTKRQCTYLTIIFELSIKDHPQLKNHIFKYNYQIRDILKEFIRFTNTEEFNPDYNDILIGSLNTLLARLLVIELEPNTKNQNKSPQHRNFENKMLTTITKYMEQNIYSPLMIDDICRQFGISRTTLQNLFQSELNISPKLYINNLRLDIAKVLLRESKYTVSEISSALGFSSIQYFSKKFKKRFKINPREYAKSNYN